MPDACREMLRSAARQNDNLSRTGREGEHRDRPVTIEPMGRTMDEAESTIRGWPFLWTALAAVSSVIDAETARGRNRERRFGRDGSSS